MAGVVASKRATKALTATADDIRADVILALDFLERHASSQAPHHDCDRYACCRIDPQLKLRLQAIATERGLTESAVPKRLVIAAVGMAPANDAKVFAVKRIRPHARVYVRLRRSDHALLRERAAARGLAAATSVSMLVRTYLQNVPPLPDRELAELRSVVGALGAVGRTSYIDQQLTASIAVHGSRF
jgi:hypothetical protein